MKGTERLVFIFDKGNNSQDNIELLESQQIPIDFVGTLTPSHHRDLVEIPLSRFQDKVRKYRVHRTGKQVFKAERSIVITDHDATARRHERRFEAQMKRVMKEANATLKSSPASPPLRPVPILRPFLKGAKSALSEPALLLRLSSGIMAGSTN